MAPFFGPPGTFYDTGTWCFIPNSPGADPEFYKGGRARVARAYSGGLRAEPLVWDHRGEAP